MSTSFAHQQTIRSVSGDYAHIVSRGRQAKLMYRCRGSWQNCFPETSLHQIRNWNARSPRLNMFPLLRRGCFAPAKGSYIHDIYIQDFALVEEQYVRLHPRFNVITGKSGSGKSVFLEAISQLCGAPAHEDLLRVDAECALLRGTFMLEADDVNIIRNILYQSGMPELDWETLECRQEAPCSPDHNIGTEKLLSLEVERRLITVRDKHLQARADDQKAGYIEQLQNQMTETSLRVRSVCKINGTTIPLKVLRELGTTLVDFNGQGAATALSTQDSQRKLLDAWGGTSKMCSSFDSLAALLCEYRAKKSSKITDAEKLNLENLIREVELVGPKIGEDVTIKTELRRMKRIQSTLERFNELSRSLGTGCETNSAGSGSNDVLCTLADSSSQLKSLIAVTKYDDSNLSYLSLTDTDEQGNQQNNLSFAEERRTGDENILGLEDALSMCYEAEFLISRAQSIIANYAGHLRVEPQLYDKYIRRLRELDRLCRKIGVKNATEAHEASKVATNKLKEADKGVQKESELSKLIQDTEFEIAEVGSLLSETRQRAAISFSEYVNDAVNFLSMDGSRFDVSLSWKSAEEISPNPNVISVQARASDKAKEGGSSSVYQIRCGGFDDIVFLMAAGLSEPLRPVRSIASGGEMARILLAIKLAPTLRNRKEKKNTHSSHPGGNTSMEDLGFEVTECTHEGHQSPVHFRGVSVFDELDSGVGARVGNQIGAALRKLSHDGGQQVLCVTHLPQVAARGDFHLSVKKRLDSHRGDYHSVGQQRKIVIDALTGYDSRVEELSHMLGLGEAPQGISAAARLLESVSHAQH